MKFGKLDHIEDVTFTLPPTPEFTYQTLSQHTPTETLTIHIGATGWSMKEWVGSYYPPKTKAKDFLTAYTQQFNTIELNTTYYRIPDQATVEKWVAQSASDFRFCPKVPQPISHSRNLGLGTPAMTQFLDACAFFGDKMGCCFMQLPPYFGVNRQELLHQFLDQWPSAIPLAIEFRHESWFQNNKAFETTLQQMQQTGIGTVITDVAGRRDVLHQMMSTATLVVRFVGNGLHPTDYQRIEDWLVLIQEWHSSGLQNVYYFTHEPDNIQSPEIAAFMAKKCQVITPFQTRGPEKHGSKVLPGQQFNLFG